MSFVYLTVLAMFTSIPVGVLSIFNFGLICRAYNGVIAIITLVFGGLFLGFLFRERRQASAMNKEAEVPEITITFPARSQAPDLQDMLKEEKDTFSAPAALFGSPFVPIDFPLANSMYALAIALGISVAYIVGFAIMTDITIRGGVNSTLPAERSDGMTYPWNINIQIAQTVTMGLEMLITLTIVISSFMGRLTVVQDEKDLREEVEYGIEA